MSSTSTETPALTLQLFETMTLIKTVEERLARGMKSGEFAFAFWPTRGQEAVAAGLGASLRGDDRLVTTYRGLHDLLAKGLPLVEILGEMLGRQVGACRGKGGTMHIANPDYGVMLSTGIVGAGPPVAVGLALAARRQQSDRVVAVTFGDGATNTGSFHEALNLAAVWQLPVVFVCQNNLYGEMTPIEATMRVDEIAVRAVAYAMPGVRVDGNDPVAVHAAISEAVDRARTDGGPSLVEAVTFRFNGHYFGDQMKYMPTEQLEAAKDADPVVRFRNRLIDGGVLTEEAAGDIEARTVADVDATFAEVLASPLASDDEIGRDVYAELEGATR